MPLQRTSLVLALALCVIAPSLHGATAFAAEPAAAPDDAAKAKAQQLYKEGQGLYESGDFAGALVKFQAAFDVIAAPGLYYNIAQCHRKLGEPEAAIAALEKFQTESKTIPPALKKDVKTQLAEQRKALKDKQKAEKAAAAQRAKEEKAAAAQKAKEEKEAAKLAAAAPVVPAVPVLAPVPPAPTLPIIPSLPKPGAAKAAPSSTTPSTNPSTTPSATPSTTPSATASASTTPRSTPTPSATAPATREPAAADTAKPTETDDDPFWTNPFVIAGAAGGAAILAAGASAVAVYALTAPGPEAPKTSLGTTDLR